MGTDGLQEKAGTAKERLDGHHQTRSEGHGHTWDEAEELATDRAGCRVQTPGYVPKKNHPPKTRTSTLT